jgi:hypothetical protein
VQSDPRDGLLGGRVALDDCATRVSAAQVDALSYATRTASRLGSALVHLGVAKTRVALDSKVHGSGEVQSIGSRVGSRASLARVYNSTLPQSEAASISSAASSAAAPLAGRAAAPVSGSAHAHLPHTTFCSLTVCLWQILSPATKQQYSSDGKKHRPVVFIGGRPGKGMSSHATWATGGSVRFVGAVVGTGAVGPAPAPSTPAAAAAAATATANAARFVFIVLSTTVF